MDYVVPKLRADDAVAWDLYRSHLSWDEQFGPNGKLPFGFFYLPGVPRLFRLSSSMTPREQEAGRFLYDDISHFRRLYAVKSDIRQYVEAEHAKFLREQRATAGVPDDMLMWDPIPFCEACSCRHFVHDRCLSPIPPRTCDDDYEWTIPAAAVSVPDSPTVSRPTGFLKPLNPPLYIKRAVVPASFQVVDDNNNIPTATHSGTAAVASALCGAATRADSPAASGLRQHTELPATDDLSGFADMPPLCKDSVSQTDALPATADSASGSDVPPPSLDEAAVQTDGFIQPLFATALDRPFHQLFHSAVDRDLQPSLTSVLGLILPRIEHDPDVTYSDLDILVRGLFPPHQLVLANVVAMTARLLLRERRDELEDIRRQTASLAATNAQAQATLTDYLRMKTQYDFLLQQLFMPVAAPVASSATLAELDDSEMVVIPDSDSDL
jgi:hypothetical protein